MTTSIHLPPQTDGHKSQKICPPATASLLLECGIAPENLDADWVDIMEMVDVIHSHAERNIVCVSPLIGGCCKNIGG